MTAHFEDHMREAAVQLGTDELETYGSALEKIATVRQPDAPDQVARVRVSFNMTIASDQRARLDDQLRDAGVPLADSDNQLMRVLAASVLIERFTQDPKGRRRSSLARDAIAALAVRILVRSGHHPVLPDLPSYADYWYERAARDLRKARRATSPPKLADVQIAPPAEGEAPPTPQEIAQKLLEEYANQLAIWAGELDPGGMASQAEQTKLLWWLMSNHPSSEPEATAVDAARELARYALYVPGPPNAGALLARRIGPQASSLVRLGSAREHVPNLQLPPNADDLLPILTGRSEVLEQEITCLEAALWLYDELTVLELLGETK